MATTASSVSAEPKLSDEEIYQMLKDLPDFDRLPLPKYFYEKFNIPPPEILTPMQAIKLMYNVANAPGKLVKTELREPAPGGVRPLIEVEPIKIEVKQGVSIEDAIETQEPSESEGREAQTESNIH
jgi:hypothetical protein